MGYRVAYTSLFLFVFLAGAEFATLLRAADTTADKSLATNNTENKATTADAGSANNAENTKSIVTSSTTAKPKSSKDSAASDQAAREKIWNSAEMLRARAWVDEYLSVTKEYTPEQKAEYKKHLAMLTAPQMELWLMRYKHDRVAAKKQETSSRTARSAAISRDQAEIKQNQKSLRDIEKGENTAAANEEKRLKSEQTFARSMYKQKQRESSRMLEEYSSGGFGWGFGGGFR